MQTPNGIILTREATGWEARFIGPHAAEIVTLFGTSRLPTGFNRNANPQAVLEAIVKRNPDCTICISH